jgi:hypothetical protein
MRQTGRRLALGFVVAAIVGFALQAATQARPMTTATRPSFSAQEPTSGPIPGVGGRLFFMNTPTGVGNDWRIMMLNLDSGATTVLADLAGRFTWTDDLDVSPDGRTIAFVGTTGGDTEYEVWTVATDGTGLAQVSFNPDSGWGSTPRWSPTEPGVIYYQKWLDRHRDSLRRLNLATGEDVELFQGYGEASKGIDISNDGTEALMVREPSCCWHPNAFTAYFALDGGGTSYRVIRSSDGRSEWGVRINRTDGWITYIDETIGTSGIVNVYIAAPDGTGAVSVTPGLSARGAVHTSTWVGGDHLKYVVATTTISGHEELIALRTDSPAWPAGVIHLTDGPGMSRYAAWTPIPADATPPVITIESPKAAYTAGEPVLASYTCTDEGSGVASCAGPVPNGTTVSTAVPGSFSFVVNASDLAGNESSATSPYAVGYGICPAFDSSKVHKSGSTVPVKLMLCDHAGTNLSSPSIVVTALGVYLASTSAPGTLEDSGNANPDLNFRYTADLAPGGGYIFNLSLKGFAVGTYVMTFRAGADPTTHSVTLRVR